MSANLKVGPNQSVSYQTWPRQAAPPVEDELNTIPSETKTMPQDRPDRPQPPERISSMPHHVERPKVPPPVVPPAHKRSASTGAPVVIPGSQQLNTMNSESASGSSPFLQAGTQVDPALHNHNNQLTPPPADKLTPSSLNRQSVARPARPLPPPPPPPENTIVEQTHL